MRLIVGFIAVLLPNLALADICQTRIDGLDLQIDPDAMVASVDTATRRERALNLPSRTFAWLRDRPRSCTSAEVFAMMSVLDDVDAQCLYHVDDDTGFILLPGNRSFRGRCTKTVCERVNDTSDGTVDLLASVSRGALGLPEDDTRSIPERTGSVILSGRAAFVAGALQQTGTAVVAALAAPAVLAAATVTVAGVGGAVYICRE